MGALTVAVWPPQQQCGQMNETSAGTPVKSVGRLGNAEMAARRLMFLLRRLQLLLDLSSKESCKAFFYSSVGSLQWTQRLLIRLWAFYYRSSTPLRSAFSRRSSRPFRF